MKLKEIHRTSTFAWSPEPALPLLATGTVAGALDESFSNASALEIWAPDYADRNEYELGGDGQPGPKATVPVSSRFNRIAWGYVHESRPRGVLAAGLENGELNVFDVSKVLDSGMTSESFILKNSTHSGPVRGLDFNSIQTNLFASGATNGEIYIWNLQDLSKPYSPGSRSTKLDEITALSWNQQVPHVLATASSTGYTVVWDLRGKREVVALAYGGGQTGGPVGSMGGRRGMSDIAWHPDNATRLVTSSEDDSSPVVMVWDLRNARAPEKILTGHEKGVLSLSWSKQDSDLLLSCGKDNRALCWNPSTAEVVAELPRADNWAYQIDWCPRNPDLFAVAFFDGTIGIHNAQTANDAAEEPSAPAQLANGADIFDNPVFTRSNQATLSLSQAPKWLRRPISATFGFGGQLVSTSNLASAQGKTQSAVVHMRKVVSEANIIERATALNRALEADTLADLAKARAEGKDDPEASTTASWKALLSLFQTNSRDELVTLLGFSKEEVASRVSEAVANLKVGARPKSPIEEDVTDTKKPFSASVVSFAEPTPGEAATTSEATPSEISASTDVTSTTEHADGESTTTAPSLFGDNAPATPQTDAAADFFSSMGIARGPGDQMDVPHHDYPVDSSVAATIASRPGSAMSEFKATSFRIYPQDESEMDRLVTKALVLGDFESAVSLCLSTDRFADAILLAARAGPKLLQKTQKEYFERRTTSHPYLRLFQSIVTDDLADIVQNADLSEWQEIFVVLCTFASPEEFAGLTEQLGQRLEFAASMAKASEESGALNLRKNATLTYLAAGKLERLVNIWIEELAEEEADLLEDEEHENDSRFNAHAQALLSLIEKVTVFRSAIKYTDSDVQQAAPVAEGATRTYKLGVLYERYFEYADLLASQGLVKEAATFLKLMPADYAGLPGSKVDFASGRSRLLAAAGLSTAAASTAPAAPALPAAAPRAPTSLASQYNNGYNAAPSSYTVSQGSAPSSNPYQVPIPPAPAPVGPYGPAGTNPGAATYPGAPAASFGGYNGSYAPSGSNVVPPAQYNTYGPGGMASHQGGQFNARPPQFATPTGPPVASAQKRGNVPGWNDAPSIPERRAGSQSNSKPGTPAPIMSPFPGGVVPPPAGFAGPTSPLPHGSGLPPPPRTSSAAGRVSAPPGPGRVVGPPPPGGFGGPPRPPTNPPGPPPPGTGRMQPGPPPPPGSGLSRPSSAAPPSRGHLPPSGPGQYAPPPGAQFASAQQPMGQPGMQVPPPPSGPYGPPPGASNMASPPPPPGPYAPPPGAAAPGPYGPPPGAQPAASPYGQPGGPGGMVPPPGAGPPPPGMGGPPPPPPPGGPAMGPARSSSLKPTKSGPPPPKYPAGDRSHIPENALPIFTVISGELQRLRENTPPQQKRFIDDLDRRVSPLFDALNCETLPPPVVGQLLELSQAMAAHDRDTAAQIHMQLITSGSSDIGLPLSVVKQLIARL